MDLAVQPIPEAELMPQPAPKAEFNTTLAVEFVDFGESRMINVVDGDMTIAAVVEEAGADWRVDAGPSPLVRNGGIDYEKKLPISSIDDPMQLIVYLMCTGPENIASLKMRIPACPDLVVRSLIARVEVPAFHKTILNRTYVSEVSVLSTDRVSAVLSGSKIDASEIQRITYEGVDVEPDTPLEEIFFRNGSTIVIYPRNPCPDHSPSPSVSPVPAPSASPAPRERSEPVIVDSDDQPLELPEKKPKERKRGVYDSYRHCKNSRGDKIHPPRPDDIGLNKTRHDPHSLSDEDAVECDFDEMTPEEEEDDEVVSSRTLKGTKTASGAVDPVDEPKQVVVNVVYESNNEASIKIKVPININVAKGIDILDAVRHASGKPHPYMEGSYQDKYPIDHYTPLKPFNLKDGDVITVRDLDRVQDDGKIRDFDMDKKPKEVHYDRVVTAPSKGDEGEEKEENRTPEAAPEYLPDHEWGSSTGIGYEVYETEKKSSATPALRG
jgi:hypothetical protein